jgi:hypothetical protein
MSDCKVFRTEIEGAADGGALGARAAAHAKVCAVCGDALRGHEALRGLVRGLGRVEAPSDFEFRLRARMAASKPGGGRGLFARLSPAGGLAWAAIAVCLLTVSAAVYFRQAQPSRQAASSGEVARGPEAPARADSVELKRTEESKPQQTNASAPVVTVAVVRSAVPKGVGVKRITSQSREREFAPREPGVESTQVGSIEAAVKSARNRVPVLNSGAGVASSVSAQGIQLGTSAETLRVVLRDERGTLVPMRSVSFGSQEPLSREAASSRAKLKDEEGVW